LEISPETVSLGGPFTEYQVTRLLTWQDFPEAAADLIAFGRLPRILSARLIPVFLFRNDLLTYLFGDPPPYLGLFAADSRVEKADPANGPVPNPTYSAGKAKERSLVQVRSVRESLSRFSIKGVNPRHLEGMLAYFQACGISTILVGVPVAGIQFECYTREIDRKFLEYMDKLGRTYGCRFVDYRNRFSDDLFSDNNHMTADGGSRFSRIFQDEVLREAWSRSLTKSRRAEYHQAGFSENIPLQD
jgi:hypothetical protein